MVDPTTPRVTNNNGPSFFPGSGSGGNNSPSNEQQEASEGPSPLPARPVLRERPSVTKRQSILGSDKRPASSGTKKKMKASGNTLGSGGGNENNPESQACVIL